MALFFIIAKNERGEKFMFKMPVTYRTYEGKEVTKDFYFNLNKGEIAEMNFAFEGGFEAWLEMLQTEPNVSDMIKVFKELIIKAYGKRLPDGQFVKTPEYTAAFTASDAYSEVFLKFIDNKDNFVSNFLEGAMNVSLEDVQKGIEKRPDLKEITDNAGINLEKVASVPAQEAAPVSEF